MSAPTDLAEHDLAACLPRLRLYFRCRGWSHEADDLASEVTIRVLGAIRRKETIQHIGAFCLGTARRVLLERYRKPADPVTMPDGWDPPAPEPEESDQQRITLLQDCLGQLGPPDRQLVLEYYGDGKGKEIRTGISARLGISLNALHIKVCRLRRQVRQCVESSGAPGGQVRD